MLEESGQWLENIDGTHLILASGKPVLQKSYRRCIQRKAFEHYINVLRHNELFGAIELHMQAELNGSHFVFPKNHSMPRGPVGGRGKIK